MLALSDLVPRRMTLAWTEFTNLGQKLLKIGAWVVEKAAHIRIHFASACPDTSLTRSTSTVACLAREQRPQKRRKRCRIKP